METVILDHQAFIGLHHHHMMPFSSVKNLILRNCTEVPVLARYLAGFPEELGLQIPTNPPEAIEYPESQRDPVLPRLEYLEIVDYANNEIGKATSWLKMVLIHKPYLRAAVGPYVGDVTAALAVRTAFCCGRARELAFLAARDLVVVMVVIHLSAISILFLYFAGMCRIYSLIKYCYSYCSWHRCLERFTSTITTVTTPN